MITTLILQDHIPDEKTLKEFLRNRHCEIAYNSDIPLDMFNELVNREHGCIVMHKPLRNGARDEGSPFGFKFIQDKPVLSRFHGGACMPYSFETQHGMPQGQTILIQSTHIGFASKIDR